MMYLIVGILNKFQLRSSFYCYFIHYFKKRILQKNQLLFYNSLTWKKHRLYVKTQIYQSLIKQHRIEIWPSKYHISKFQNEMIGCKQRTFFFFFLSNDREVKAKHDFTRSYLWSSLTCCTLGSKSVSETINFIFNLPF